MRLWLATAALHGMLAVMAGAWGWHGQAADGGDWTFISMGSDYQMWHALALLGVAWLADRHPSRAVLVAGVGFNAGIVLFSGSLYMLGQFGFVPIEGAAPVGGFCLIAGWMALGWAAVRRGS